jgi:hypothetical protein
MKVQNDLINAVDDNIEALRRFAKAEEDLNAKERKIAADLSQAFVDREKSVARQAATQVKQAQAMNEFAATIEKVRKANTGINQEASKALQSLSGNEAEIKRIYAELEKLDKKGQELIANVSAAAQAGNTAQVEQLLNDFKNGLDPEQAQAFAEGMEDGFKKVENAIARPTRELRELQRQITAGELEGAALDKAIARAAALKDEIGDVQQRIAALSSDTYTLDAVVGGFETLAGGAAVAEGAMAIFGVESEDVQQTLVRLNAIMAVSQGLQQVSNQLLGEGAFKTKLISSAQAVYAAAVGTSSGAMKTFRTALLATGIGAAVVAIGALVANWDKLSAAISGFSEKQVLQNEIQKKAMESVADEVAGLEILRTKYSQTSSTQQDRIKAMEDLKAKYPSYLSSVNTETTTYNDLEEAISKVNDALILKAQRVATEELLTEAIKEQMIAQQEYNALQQGTASFLDETAASFKNAFALGGTTEITETGEKVKNLQSILADYNNQLASIDEQDKITKMQEQAEAEYKLQREQAEAKRKQAIAEQKRLNDELKARQSTFYNEMSALFDQANQAEIEGLRGEEKLAALAALEDEKISIIEESTREMARQAGFQGEELSAKYVEIEEYITALRLDAQRKATAEIVAYRAEQAAQELDATQASLEQAEQIEINRAAARLELQRNSFADESAFEDFKNQELLKINLAYAQKRLELLQGSTDQESELQKSQLERTIAELQNQIADAAPQDAAQGEKSFLMSLLGLDEQGLEQFKNAAAQAAQALIGMYSQINAARIQDVENQIQASDAVLSRLNQQLEEEKGLKAEGLANNVSAVELEIAEEQRRREAALAEKQKLQKRQALVDAATQASSLITATAQIFAAESTKGLIGVLTAVGAVASLFAIFMGTKAKIKAATQLRHGGSGDKTGMVTGRSHEQGGEQFLDHVEVESGEQWGVLNRGASRKYGRAFHNMVEAMNNGIFDVPKLPMPLMPSVVFTSDPDFEAMRYGRGASELIAIKQELKETNAELKRMSKKLSEIESKPTTWQEGDETITKIGNKTIRTKRKRD